MTIEAFDSKTEYRERALLVGADVKEKDFRESMEELWNLAKACNMEPVAQTVQKMESIHKGLYIGAGKVKEVKDIVEKLNVDIIIFNNSLTPSQLGRLQDELEKPVIDRTALILDIFESRARTREAKLQVEAAKLQYLLPRLVGLHEALTRQGGTSGSMSSRGAGEKKLELDRRRIEHRLTELRKELSRISSERKVQRKKRVEARLPLVALVGYTNAGKSTIMNALIEEYGSREEKKVLEKDMPFATLDTTVRRIDTGNNQDFLLSDTVGFIHDLPHSLIKAFRSTLEEVQNAELLLHVVDRSDPAYLNHMKTTMETLTELSAGDIPIITVFNKADLCTEAIPYPKAGSDKIYISAREAASIRLLVRMILEKVYAEYVEAVFLFPYDRGDLVSYFRENSRILEQEHLETGTRLTLQCHRADREKYREYLAEPRPGNKEAVWNRND